MLFRLVLIAQLKIYLFLMHLQSPLMTQKHCLSILAFCFFAGAIFVFPGCNKNGPSPAPVIPATLSVAPAVDTMGGIVTITGANFNTTASRDTVIFSDSIAAQVLSASATQLTVVVPYYAVKGKIIVRANGSTAQTAQDFVVAPKFFPQSEGAGYAVTVFAEGNGVLSDYSVKFNGVPAKATGLFQDLVTVIVPAGAANGPISVTYKGHEAASLTSFTVAPVGVVTTLAGNGSYGSVDGTGGVASFFNPLGMVTDGTGNVFVADLNGGTIRMITPAGVVSTFAGNGSFGSTDGALLSAGFYGPSGITMAKNGDIYVTDQFSSRIRKISSGYVTTIVGAGPGASPVFSPIGICMDGTGNLYVGDALNEQVKKIAPDGTLTTLAGVGTQGFMDGPGSGARFNTPSGLVLDAAGNLYVADMGNSRIRMVSTSGVVSSFAGSIQDYKDGTGTNASFNQPTDVAMDGSGNIYVADRGNQVIRRITPAGVVTTIAGSPGQKGFADGEAAAAAFSGPAGITIDKNGVIYVSDQGNSRIRKITIH